MTKARDLATSGPASGLVAIDPSSVAVGSGSYTISDNNVNFSNVSSVSLNDIFTSSYENYNIKIELSAISIDCGLRFRFRASGTDDSGGNYIGAYPAISYLNAAANNYSGAGATSHQFGTADAGTSAHFYFSDIIINKPAVAVQTLHTLTFTAVLTPGGVTAGAGGGVHNNGSVFDGITFFPASGTFSGKVWVYGYRN
jgi:hypothetical protein